MFSHNQSGYKVEESSMEEFLKAIKQQKARSPQQEYRYNHLERKLFESQLQKKFYRSDESE